MNLSRRVLNAPEPETTERALVTPEFAERLLTNVAPDNLGRMPPRAYQRYWERLAADMRAGAWASNSHEGILLGKDDCVIDGYNRLNAVVLSGCSVRMLIIRQPWRTLAKEIVQNVGVPWRADFILGQPKVLVSAVNLAAYFLIDPNIKLTTHQQGLGCNALASPFNELFGGGVQAARGINAPFILATCVSALEGKASVPWLSSQITAWKNRDPKNLAPATYSAWKQLDGAKVFPQEAVLRLYNAFDESERMRIKIQIKDIASQRATFVSALKRHVHFL